MKFVQFHLNDNPNDIRLGCLSEDNVVDLCCQQQCGMPTKMLQVLKAGIADKLQYISTKKTIPLSCVTLVAPIFGIDKILGVALNFADHCKEIQVPRPAIPMIFSKYSSTIIGPNDALRIRTEVCKKVDWEVELAVVIGKTASSVAAADVDHYIFGYTIAQDISEREWQKEKNGAQFLLGKSQDTFCPIGPCIVTKDEIGDVTNLNMKCSVNGVVKQKSNTKYLIHSIPNIIERITTVMTLLPGDLILTGTPGGVGGNAKPQEFLKPGDVIRSEIQNIGVFETRVEEF
ncbi:hypothetical protein PYW07_010044 [Mythimna separata]|uniref:Fumarylacetoacetase-like C-terminal domain-containing protein n=1 Tax=Mythimna separata TaxID=271217 RepID=A0AAD8DQ75_MYTSE|nr:hypothetical protein PYW07_010044 [Mythimna separata]